MNILAIETSCDETSVAIVEDGVKLRSLVVNSQIDLHRAYGGVVPEVAARSHLEVMIPVIQQALDEAFPDRHSRLDRESSKTMDPLIKSEDDNKTRQWDEIDAIAVTQGPGLLGALLIGTLTARTLAWALKKPLYPVHHILGHIYANWITEDVKNDERLAKDNELAISNDSMVSHGKSKIDNALQVVNRKSLMLPKRTPEFPVLALIVSGGHTQLMYGASHDDWRVIGRTQDDAVGEAFDKAAKVLGLPYPGGPSIAKAAVNGDPNRYKLTTPRLNTMDPGLQDLRATLARHPEPVEGSTQISPQGRDDKPATYSLNFSFSGLKTGFLRAVQKECGVGHDFPSFELAARLNDAQVADFAASFEQTAINYLVSHTKKAFEEFSPKTLIIGGGVAASLPLRKALSDAIPLEITYAPQILCTDNAAMIAARAFFQSKFEEPIDPRKLDPKPSWPL